MLKKSAIGASVGLAAIIAVAFIFNTPLETNEKNPGLVPPSVNLYDMIGLDEIDKTTPNKITDRDLGPFDQQFSTEQPNKQYVKFQSIRGIIDFQPSVVKILSDEDNTRTTILISPKDIPTDKGNIEYIYSDLGVIISIYERQPNVPDDIFVQEMTEGQKIVNVLGHDAVLRPVQETIVSDVHIDIPLSLEMLTDTNQISIIGFISEDQAIKYAEFVASR